MKLRHDDTSDSESSSSSSTLSSTSDSPSKSDSTSGSEAQASRRSKQKKKKNRKRKGEKKHKSSKRAKPDHVDEATPETVATNVENADTVEVSDDMDEDKQPPRTRIERGAHVTTNDDVVVVDAAGNDTTHNGPLDGGDDSNPSSRYAKQLVGAAERRWKASNEAGEKWRDKVSTDIAAQMSKLQNLSDKCDTYTREVDTMEAHIIACMEKLLGKGGKDDTTSSATATPPGQNGANRASNTSNSAVKTQDGPNGAPTGTAEKWGAARRTRLGLQRRLAPPSAPQKGTRLLT